STSRLGVTFTPRRPGFDFEGLEHEVPRAWHPDGIGPTAFLEALSAMAPVVEGFFVDDARRLLPRIADGATRAEGDAFLRQEAAYAGMHTAFNRLLIRWDVPVEPIADSALRWLAIVDWTSSDLRSAVAMAGEHFLGEIGNAILSRPELLDGVDPRIARLFRWHGFEEVEHKAVLFDVFHAARGRGLYTYAVRIAGLWIAVVLLALALPSVSYRILASAGAARELHAWRGLSRFVFGRGAMPRGRCPEQRMRRRCPLRGPFRRPEPPVLRRAAARGGRREDLRAAVLLRQPRGGRDPEAGLLLRSPALLEPRRGRVQPGGVQHQDNSRHWSLRRRP